MPSNLPRAILEVNYEEAAQAYLRSLTLENIMEATAQATQRKITLESLDVVRVYRPDLHVFNELLVQYPYGPDEEKQQIVPDNMAVISKEPLQVEGHFSVPLQTARPFWVMEYVSKHNKRKDYDRSFKKYERELKVPYYLIFYPDNQELSLYKHTGRKYVSVKPNEHGRYPIPELEIEVALLDGWVRFWFRGHLVPLPADMERQLTEERRRVEEATRRADEETRRAEEALRRADEETRRAEEALRRADEEERLRMEAERVRQALEQQVAELRAQLERRSPPPDKGS
jgi:Uma2 family endonuclease